MIQLQYRPLSLALLLGMGMLTLAPMSQAQSNRHTRQQAQAEAPPPAYPNATRQEPDAKATPKMLPKLKAMQESYEHEDWAAVIATADEIGAATTAGAYDKSFAFTMAGNAASNLNQPAKAADYFAKSVAANGLDNNGHFATMYNLAVTQFGEEKYADALATLDRFLAETRSDKPEHLSLRAGILASMGRNDEAAAAYQALLAKNPGDKRLLLNAASALQAAEKYDQANTLLNDAFNRGMLTEERELRVLYVGYLNSEHFDDAKRVIDAGVAKGILKPGPELGQAYQLLAQNAYFAEKMPQALDFYTRAAPMMADGEGYLNLAKVLEYVGRKADAKEAARQALAKGVKKPEEANRILSH